MRMRKKPWASKEIEENPFVVQGPEEYAGKWRGLFKNENPVHIEIGMGKGQFIIGRAEAEPEVSFVGIERQMSVFASASRNIRFAQTPNIRLVCMDACALSDVFSEQEVSHIYINFCDPWPKKKWEKRRLTHASYLAAYERILEKEGVLDFRSDSFPLFQFSLNELTKRAWNIEKAEVRSGAPDGGKSSESEYEHKFLALGKEIYEITAIAPRV